MTDLDHGRKTGPALEKTYRFLLWLVPTLKKFPRAQKFMLGDRIQATALDVLEGLIEATYTRDRAAHLARVNLRLEKLRILFRLAKDLRSAKRNRNTTGNRNNNNGFRLASTPHLPEPGAATDFVSHHDFSPAMRSNFFAILLGRDTLKP